MTLTPAARKLAVLAHITTSASWLGAVACFLVLAIAGLTSPNAQLVRAAYLAMPPITGSIIVPLAFGSLLTGFLLSFGTPWGLVRHYWILAKLLINSLSIVLLLLHMRIISEVATAAAKTTLSTAGLHEQRIKLVVVAAAALAVLFFAMILSVYKPRGLTPYGWKKRHKQPMS
jgi:hypothetical protein